MKLVHSKDRLKTGLARNSRAGMLGKYAQLHVFKTGIMPAVRHGTMVHGASMALIRQVRQSYGVKHGLRGGPFLQDVR